MFRFPRAIVVPLCAAAFLASCASPAGYYQNMNAMISQKRYLDAATIAEKSKEQAYGEKNAILYHLDRGFLLHLGGQPQESLASFEKAKKLAKDYFTKSITTEASTLLVSDNTRPYYGEDFERALIHIFSSLNYASIGKESEALVEARQVDHFLKTLQVNYGYKNVYKEDAFARYLMGMFYENQGQFNDAYISYYQALEAYGDYQKYFQHAPPRELVSDCLRLGEKLGFSDDVQKLRKSWTVDERNIPAGSGEIVVLDYNGFSPEKVDTFVEIAFGKAWAFVGAYRTEGEDERKVEEANAIARSIVADEQVRMAFPKYIDVPYRARSVEVKPATGPGATVKGTVVDDIGAIAKQNLEDRINRIRIRTIVRATIKYVLSHKVTEKVEGSQGQLAGWIAKKALAVASTATEKSDKRSWRSLPDKILMARLIMPQGVQSVQLVYRDKDGNEVARETIENIQVRAGRKTFVTTRSAL